MLRLSSEVNGVFSDHYQPQKQYRLPNTVNLARTPSDDAWAFFVLRYAVDFSPIEGE